MPKLEGKYVKVVIAGSLGEYSIKGTVVHEDKESLTIETPLLKRPRVIFRQNIRHIEY